MTIDEEKLLNQWILYPEWNCFEALALLEFRIDPRLVFSQIAFKEFKEMGLHAMYHFHRFGAPDPTYLLLNVGKEYQGIYLHKMEEINKTPVEWVEIYQDYRDGKSLPDSVIDNLFTEDEKQPDTQPNQAAKEPLFEAISPSLAAMNQAAHEFWSTADRDDPSTHPDNAAVAAWLTEKVGLSKTAAVNAASLIRPEWAFNGRKPDKG